MYIPKGEGTKRDDPNSRRSGDRGIDRRYVNRFEQH